MQFIKSPIYPCAKLRFLLLTLGLMALGVLLSFSRGAWMNFAFCALVFVYLSFVTSGKNSYRFKNYWAWACEYFRDDWPLFCSASS